MMLNLPKWKSALVSPPSCRSSRRYPRLYTRYPANTESTWLRLIWTVSRPRHRPTTHDAQTMPYGSVRIPALEPERSALSSTPIDLLPVRLNLRQNAYHLPRKPTDRPAYRLSFER